MVSPDALGNVGKNQEQNKRYQSLDQRGFVLYQISCMSVPPKGDRGRLLRFRLREPASVSVVVERRSFERDKNHLEVLQVSLTRLTPTTSATPEFHRRRPLPCARNYQSAPVVQFDSSLALTVVA